MNEERKLKIFIITGMEEVADIAEREDTINFEPAAIALGLEPSRYKQHLPLNSLCRSTFFRTPVIFISLIRK